uniref:MFS transporter n=1 Tax=Ignisphaera aggregans TaxID=334771 RepID=A0A7C5YY28_9CREN
MFSVKEDLALKPNILISLLIVFLIMVIIYGTSSINTLHGLLISNIWRYFIYTVLFLEYVNPRILHSLMFRKSFLATNTVALLSYSATYALTILLSTYLQKLRNLTPSETGLILATQSSNTKSISGLLADRYNPSTSTSLGMTIITIGIFSLSFISSEISVNYLIYTLVILGVGFTFLPLLTLQQYEYES